MQNILQSYASPTKGSEKSYCSQLASCEQCNSEIGTLCVAETAKSPRAQYTHIAVPCQTIQSLFNQYTQILTPNQLFKDSRLPSSHELHTQEPVWTLVGGVYLFSCPPALVLLVFRTQDPDQDLYQLIPLVLRPSAWTGTVSLAFCVASLWIVYHGNSQTLSA